MSLERLTGWGHTYVGPTTVVVTVVPGAVVVVTAPDKVVTLPEMVTVAVGPETVVTAPDSVRTSVTEDALVMLVTEPLALELVVPFGGVPPAENN